MNNSYPISMSLNNTHPTLIINEGHQWFVANWTCSFYISLVYVIIIFSIKRFMRNRPALELSRLLVLWNLSLSVFSIIVSWRTVLLIGETIANRGVTEFICDNSYFDHRREEALWCLLYTISKVPELLDTIFIVLRKRPLMFLHWYHHITVMLYSWYSYSTLTSSSASFGGLNTIIHAFMYTYYTVAALKMKIPRLVAMFVTSLQLSQMAVGCYINWVAYRQLREGATCHISMDNIAWSFIMYISYLCLFAHYFWKAYIRADAKRGVTKIAKNKTT